MYTGIPSISIPVYNYKGGANGLSLNISLDYHSGGIRVEEVGGNVGMGWALNAGGVICRTMRGQPDDMPAYGWLALYPNQPPGTGSNDGTIDNLYTQNGEDAEQDVFDFNFNGHSGRFILDGHGNPIIINQQNINIQPIAGPNLGLPFQGFIATDEMGIKYIFTDNETTNINVSQWIPSTVYSSSWYLTAMVNPFTGDSIRFTYNTAVEYYQTFGSETADNEFTGGTSVSKTTLTSNSQYNSYNIVAKKIKRISCPNNVVLDFFYQPISRCDLIGDSVLSAIRQTDGLTGASMTTELFQSYIDQYGHKYPYSPAPCSLTGTVSSTGLRLRLDSVQESSGALFKPPYVFTYNDTFLLPPRNSKQQDLWGFYNGTFNPGTTMIPFYLYNDALNNDSYFLDGADRRADSNGVKAGSLVQIKYPTGGTTHFNYEVNRAGDNKLVMEVPDYQAAGFNFASGNDTASGSTPITINRTPENQGIDFDFVMGSWCPGLPQDATIVFSIVSLDGQTVYATETFGYADVGTTKTAVGTAIPNGNYLLTFQINGPPSYVCDEVFGFALQWQYSQADSTQLAGGLRIASIVNYDGINHQNDVVKQYKYVDTTGISSGTTGIYLSFGYNFSNCTVVGSGSPEAPDAITVYDHFMRTATTNIPLAYTEGSPVGYTRVEVATIGPSNIGKEVDYFTGYSDFPVHGVNVGGSGLFNFPFTPCEVSDWALGKVTRQEIYDGDGHLMKKTINNYLDFENGIDTLVDFKIAMTQNGNCQVTGDPEYGGDIYPPTTYQLQSYYWWLGHLERTSTTTVDYTTAGDSLTDQITYQYDPLYFDDITQETHVDSKGDTVITYHYYPFDYTISGSALGDMVDSNMIADRVSDEQWKDLGGAYYLISADAINYSRFSSGILPGKYYMLKAAAPVAKSNIGTFDPSQLLRVPSLYDQRLSFDSYDPKGNPTQIDQHGTITNYIWDINHQFPIARIANADTADIAYTSFEADGSGNWSIGSGSVDTTTAITGRNSYNLAGSITASGLNPSTTYIVSYWSQNGPYSIPGTLAGYPVQGKTVIFTNPYWTLYVHKVTGQNTITLTGTGHIDELRLYPSTAQMTTYTYSPLVGTTSQTDAGNRVTYYEYDGLARLKRIRDQDHNILRSFDYQYQAAAGCGSGCYILSMQTFTGTGTLSYPVGVFNISGKLLGNAAHSTDYVTLWNSDTADTRIGTLSAGADSMHFNITMNSGQTPPASVIGCRFYQWDIPWTDIDALFAGEGAYVDFGDGTGMPIPRNAADTAHMAPNTEFLYGYYIVHNYPDSSMKTITIYHNDGAEPIGLDNANSPATSLTRVRHLRGNFPQHTSYAKFSSMQQASALTFDSIYNWNSITSLDTLQVVSGDGGIDPCKNVSYAQDFAKDLKGLTVWYSTLGGYEATGIRDTTFKLSRLRSDWNTYFTNLQELKICDDHWDHEDLSALTKLHRFSLVATTSDHENDNTNTPVPIPSPVLDSVLIQIAAGAGQNISNGVILMITGGTNRTTASDAAVAFLRSKGWQIYITW